MNQQRAYRSIQVRHARTIRAERPAPVLVALSVRRLEPAPDPVATACAGLIAERGAAVEAELVLPGCAVSPPGRLQLDPTADVAHVRFDVTAASPGRSLGGRVRVLQNGRLLAELPLELLARPAWAPRLSRAWTVLRPLAALVLKKFGPEVGSGALARSSVFLAALGSSALWFPLWCVLGAFALIALGAVWVRRKRHDRFSDLVPRDLQADASERAEEAYLAVRSGAARADELLALLTADHPRCASGWFLLGDRRYDRGDRSGALDPFRRGLSLDAAAPPVVYAKAAAAAALAGDVGQARVWAERGLERADRDPRLRAVLLYNRGCYLCRLGQLNRAEDALAEAVAAGFTDVQQLRTDRDLIPLRTRPRFRALLGGLPLANREAVG